MGDQPGQVVDLVHPVHRPEHARRVGHVGAHDLDVRIVVGRQRCATEQAHSRPGLGPAQVRDEVAAEKAGAPGDEERQPPPYQCPQQPGAVSR